MQDQLTKTEYLKYTHEREEWDRPDGRYPVFFKGQNLGHLEEHGLGVQIFSLCPSHAQKYRWVLALKPRSVIYQRQSAASQIDIKDFESESTKHSEKIVANECWEKGSEVSRFTRGQPSDSTD